MGLLVVLLLGEVGLDLAQVQQLGALLELGGQLLLERLPVLLEFLGVLVLEGEYLVLVLLLRVFELLVPVLVELLVLFNVRLLALLALLLVHKDHLLHLAGVLLFLELRNPIFGHLRLHIATLLLASASVFLHCVAKRLGARIVVT